MTTSIDSLEQNVTHAKEGQPIGGLRFDWIMVGLSTWFLGGLFVDGWAHSHIPQLETFFTPWHAVFYSGFLVVATFLGVSVLRNHLRGYRWLKAIPAGYELSVLGAIVFAISGVGDMLWHIFFGIEADLEALLSPTHLGLALGLGLVVSGPLRAAWRRLDNESAQNWKTLFPMILSLTFTLSLLTFFTEYSHPFVNIWAVVPRSAPLLVQRFGQIIGIDSILLQTALLMSFVLFAIRRWRLPIGAFTLIFTLNAASMTVLTRGGQFEIPIALLAGFATDLVYRWLRPSEVRPTALRLFAFLVPVMLYLTYYLYIIIVGAFLGFAITWTIHLWMGSIVIAGIIGLLLSYLLIPPARPVVQQESA